MFNFLFRIFSSKPPAASKHVAKERLRLVLVHDRTDLSPQLMQSLKADLIRVISDYIEFDASAMEVFLKNTDNSIALVATIPIKRIKRTLPSQLERVG